MTAGLPNPERTTSGILEKKPPAKHQGLTEEEAQSRLRAHGYNELPTAKPPTMLHTALQVLREPMFLLLIAAGIVYLLLGDPHEALALLVALSIIIVITFVQERKTETALQALRDLSSPRAMVIRDGLYKRIAGREVVRGDVVVLAEGDRIPADAVVVESSHLEVDESLLTGESLPVRKVATTAAVEMGRAGGDDQPFVFSGTMVLRGHGLAEAKGTGVTTELGKIGKSLQTLTSESTQLQQETGRIVRVFAVLGIGLCVAVALIYGYTRSDWLHGVLAGLTLAISMVPEEFPVVLTIFLAMGAWRIARSRVLARRMPVIETLGSATVLCVDKTGTLTQNRMSVQRMFRAGEWLNLSDTHARLPSHFDELLEYSILASKRHPFDSMEKAFLELGRKIFGAEEVRHSQWTLIREYPLTRELLAMSRIWEGPGETFRHVAAKGAPESVMELCRLSAAGRQQLLAATQAMAAEGLRVLAVARATLPVSVPAPLNQREISFDFLGLVGMADPIRPSVPHAVAECYRAGVRVVMITGDYPVTAQNIAAQIGLNPAERVITGTELDALTDEELRTRIADTNIFARVAPEQKLRLVQALKGGGEVVAMTGDGVNDAPALKAAHIGIAMGARGTDVAREAASLVLMDDDFSSIVSAIRQGRRIYDNLKKATAYILAIHVPIAGITLIPVLLKWPLVLLPLHVLFLELIIDPTCSIAFEAEPQEANVMARPPRGVTERLFTIKRVGLSLLQGFTVLITVLAVYGFAFTRGHTEADCRSLAFSTLIVGNLSLIFVNRSWSRTVWQTLRSPNRALWWVTVGALAMLAMVLYVPTFRDLFQFAFMHPVDLMVAGAAGFAGVVWFEVFKLAGKSLRSA